MRRVPLLICLLAAASACAAPAGASASGRSPAEVERLQDEGVREIIVARDPGLSATARDNGRAAAGVEHVADLSLPDTEVVRAPAGDLKAAIDALEAEPGVRYAEPNGPVQAATTDPLWSFMWGLENTGQNVAGVTGAVDADIDAPEAWTRSTGLGQTVAVVDSGITPGHADLQGAIATNPGESGAKATNNVDDDGDGLVDDVHGWDYVQGDNDPTDTFGHGTHVSGILAARKDNGVGIAGVAPDAQLLPLRVLDATGTGADSDIALAFDFAGDHGIRVVNASITEGFSATVEAAIARHPNTLYVVAAGNDGADDDSAAVARRYPCALPEANVICVGASDPNDARAGFSNVGRTNVDLFAPGVQIASTYIQAPAPTCTTTPCYVFLDGTSMAAPHLAATLALMRAVNPSLNAAQLKAAVLATVDPKAGLAGLAATGGRLNAANAVAAAAGAPPATSTASAAAGSGAAAATAPSAAPAPVRPVVAAPVLSRPSIGAGALTARHALTIRFTLDRAATVKLTIGRGAKTVATVSLHGRKGTNRYVLRTKVGSRRLAPGRYRVRLQARGAARAYTLAVTVR